MSSPPPLPSQGQAPSVKRTLRLLFLTLFLRGRTSRGLNKAGAPKSVGSKLALTLVLYGLFGLVALSFLTQPVFALSLYLHGMTLAFLGMFVAASAGEILFNKEEADILLHRPVSARALLWAKIGVLVQVSLWLAGAFNFAGFFVGMGAKDGSWVFLVAHALSTGLEALFCVGLVVLVYQLCLRWFGRERLDGLMTTAQVLVAVGAVLGSQMVPQLIGRSGGPIRLGLRSWWLSLLPPAWFAGFDDALAGSGASGSWALGAVALVATATVLWLAFGKLARNYETGLQALGETRSQPKGERRGRRWMEVLVHSPPLCWWLRDSVERAAFLLTAAYLARDRDVKLRVYPGLAPMMAMPFVLLLQDHGSRAMGGFGVAFAGAYLGLIPLLGLGLLQYSQQWQASDLFRAAPIPGPAALCHGARRAVLCFLALPAGLLFALFALLFRSNVAHLPLLLPGLIALPVYAMVACLGGKAVPFSLPIEEAKAAGRSLIMFLVMLIAGALAALATWAWAAGFFNWLLLVETVLSVCLYASMRRSLRSVRWGGIE